MPKKRGGGGLRQFADLVGGGGGGGSLVRKRRVGVFERAGLILRCTLWIALGKTGLAIALIQASLVSLLSWPGNL